MELFPIASYPVGGSRPSHVKTSFLVAWGDNLRSQLLARWDIFSFDLVGLRSSHTDGYGDLIVVNQLQMPYDSRVLAGQSMVYSDGHPVAQMQSDYNITQTIDFPVQVEFQWDINGSGIVVKEQISCLYGNGPVFSQMSMPITFTISKSMASEWNMNEPINSQTEINYSITTSCVKSLTISFDILDLDRVNANMKNIWNLSSDLHLIKANVNVVVNHLGVQI